MCKRSGEGPGEGQEIDRRTSRRGSWRPKVGKFKLDICFESFEVLFDRFHISFLYVLHEGFICVLTHTYPAWANNSPRETPERVRKGCANGPERVRERVRRGSGEGSGEGPGNLKSRIKGCIYVLKVCFVFGSVLYKLLICFT